MKQLIELTGMSRQAIHFYVKKGLVPAPIKRGKTSAEYTDEHLERILEVRRMREEQFLPLDAIRASLDERDEGFTAAQRRIISAVRSQFSVRKRARGRHATISVTAAARKAGVPPADVEELVETGLIEGAEGASGRISRDDLWMVELWGEARSMGFDAENGFSPADLALHERHVEALVREEVAMVADRLADLAPEQLSEQIERILPVIGALLARLHDRAVRRFLAEMSRAGDGQR